MNELIAAIFKMRGRVLWQGLCNLLPTGAGNKNIAQQVFDHPLIDGLSPSQRPSYIPSRTFALALLDVVSGGTGKIGTSKDLEAKIDLLSDDLKRPLKLLLYESRHNLDRFTTNIEIWFNNSMDRVSGVYKREGSYALFFLSFLLAAGLNVDTIVLANRLSHDSALRSALVSHAEAAAKLPAPPAAASGDKTLDDAQTALAGTIKALNELASPSDGTGRPKT